MTYNVSSGMLFSPVLYHPARN